MRWPTITPISSWEEVKKGFSCLFVCNMRSNISLISVLSALKFLLLIFTIHRPFAMKIVRSLWDTKWLLMVGFFHLVRFINETHTGSWICMCELRANIRCPGRKTVEEQLITSVIYTFIIDTQREPFDFSMTSTQSMGDGLSGISFSFWSIDFFRCPVDFPLTRTSIHLS